MHIPFAVLARSPYLASFTTPGNARHIEPVKAWTDAGADVELGDAFDAMGRSWYRLANVLEEFQSMSRSSRGRDLDGREDEVRALFAAARHWMCDEIEKLVPRFEARTGSREPFDTAVPLIRAFDGGVAEPCCPPIAPDEWPVHGVPRTSPFPGPYRGGRSGYDVVGHWVRTYGLDIAVPEDEACIALVVVLSQVRQQFLSGFDHQIERAQKGFGIEPGLDYDALVRPPAANAPSR